MKRFLMALMVGLTLLGAARSREAAQAQQTADKPATPKTALTGLDPIEFLAGKAVPGSKDISVDFNHFRYVFANQENKALFTKEPTRYGIQGDGTCPVVPTAKVDPGIVTIYKGRIYAFATLPCMGLFGKDPAKYLAKWPGNPDRKKGGPGSR